MVRALASNGSLIQRPENVASSAPAVRPSGGRATCSTSQRRRRRARLGTAQSRRDRRVRCGPPGRLERARLTQNERGICQSLDDLTLADGPAPDQDLVNNEDRALVCAALRRLSPFEAWVICERFGLGEPAGRGEPGLGAIANPHRRRTARQPRPALPTSTPVAGTRACRVVFSATHISIWDGLRAQRVPPASGREDGPRQATRVPGPSDRLRGREGAWHGNGGHRAKPTRVHRSEGHEPGPRLARSADRSSAFDAPRLAGFWKS